jgi:hypothetical protein
MAKEKIVEKVKKLLALSESSNKHEAELAAQKAKQLLMQHGMSMSDIEIKSEKIIEDVFTINYADKAFSNQTRKRFPIWILELMGMIKLYFFVEVVIHNKYMIIFIGAEKDLEIAKHVFFFLLQKIELSATEYIKKEEKNKSVSQKRIIRNSYCRGFVHGVVEKLEEENLKKYKTKTGTDLVVVKNQHVKEYLNKKYPNLVKTIKKVTSHEHNSYLIGKEKGKNTDLYKPVKKGDKKCLE